jgi:hypothetical protein
MIRLRLNIVQRHTQHVCRLVLGSPSVSGSVELVKGTLLRTKAGWIAFFLETHCKRFYGDHASGFSGFFVRSLLCLAWFVRTLCPFLSSCYACLLLLCICIFWEGEAFFQDECVGLYWIVLVCFVEVMSAY